MRMKVNLILDASNLLYRNFFVYIKDKDAEDIIVGICNQSALISMNYYYKMYNPDNIIMVFDDKSWRKEYTRNLDNCYTNKRYKGTRRKKLSSSQEAAFEIFDEHIDEFYKLLKKHTKVTVLRRKLLEADDLIAGFVQEYADDDNIIISADKDFIQLLGNPNVRLIDPISKTHRTLDEWKGDSDLFMFEKCFRGDISDNVQSSYPRLRKTKIFEAYDDEFKFNNLMEHMFTVIDMNEENNPQEYEYITRDIFQENELLMDLTKQPETIRKLIKKTIKHELKRDKTFNYFNFLRFCHKNDMVRIVENGDSLKEMLINSR